MSLIVAPTEPPELRAVATAVTTLPELYGADVFFYANMRKCGIQRKEYKDFIASVNDGRLGKEVQQMQALDYKVLIIEGELKWTNEGNLILPNNYTSDTWNQDRWDGLIWSIQDRDIWVHYTDSLSSTITTIQRMERWFSKTSHSSLGTKPNTGGSLWGTGVQHKPFANWMLQSFPGIGHKLADQIIDTIGFPLVLAEGVDLDKLMTVPGIGKNKAELIIRVMDKGEGESNG